MPSATTGSVPLTSIPLQDKVRQTKQHSSPPPAERVLLVANSFPNAIRMGSQQRTTHFYNALKLRFEVDVLVIDKKRCYFVTSEGKQTEFNFEGDAYPARAIGRYVPPGMKSTVVSFRSFFTRNRVSESLSLLVKRLHSEQRYKHVLCRYFYCYMRAGLYLGGDARRVIVDLDDVPWKVIESQTAALPGGMQRRGLQKIGRWLQRLYCLRYLRRAGLLILSNPLDRSGAVLKNAQCVENIPRITPALEGTTDIGAKSILLVANLEYAPNVDGLVHFVSAIWPVVRAEEPTALLEVAGNFDPDNTRIAELNNVEGLRLLGFVEDLSERYARAQFCIAPVYWGGGTKIKVIESLSFFRTIIATPHAISGFEHLLDHGDSVLIANSDEAFSRHCVFLLGNRAKCEEMGSRGRRIVEEHYTFETFCSQLDQVLQISS